MLTRLLATKALESMPLAMASACASLPLSRSRALLAALNRAKIVTLTLSAGAPCLDSQLERRHCPPNPKFKRDKLLIIISLKRFSSLSRPSQRGDADGFLWSTKLLQGVIGHFSEKDLEPESLSVFLLECFANDQQQEEEDPQALSAFHVAALHRDKALFDSCLDSARSDFLRYHAAMGLGLIIQQDGGEGALKCFQVAKSIAEGLDVEYRAIASYWMMKTLAQLQEANIALDQVFTGSVISSALVTMVKAKIKQKEGQAGKEVVSVYAEARRTLANFMVNLNDKLAERLESSCCSTLFLLEFIRYDNFTKFSMLMLPSRPDPEVLATPLNVCFAAYDFYREARLEILKLQENWNDAKDARAHIEEGYDTGLDSLVLGHEIALKMDDLDSIYWAGVFLDNYISREITGDTQAMVSRLAACFEKYENEDNKAWAYYYVGRKGTIDGRFSRTQYELLEKSLEQAKTGMLRYFAAYTLGHACSDKKSRQEYLDSAKHCALQTGNEELIIDVMLELFVLLIERQMFQNASELRQELEKMINSSHFSSVVFGEGVVALMEGHLKVAWGDHSGSFLHFQRAVQLLEPLQTPYPAALVTYMCGENKRTVSYFGRACLQRSFSSASTAIENFVKNSSKGIPHLGIELYDEAQLEFDEILESLKELDKLEEEGDLEQQESQIAHLLQALKRDHREIELHGRLEVFEARVWMKMAHLAHAYLSQEDDQIASPTSLVNEFMTQATQLAEATFLRGTAVPPVLCSHGFLLWKMGFTRDAVQKLEQALRHWLRVDENFGYVSTGRISNIESIKVYFKGVQMVLFEANEFKRAMIWSERSHARDMLFLVTREGDRENSTEFDMDDDRAWLEVEEISKLMGKDTAIVVISHLSTAAFSSVATYLLHDGELVDFRKRYGFQVCSPSDLLELMKDNDADSALRDYYDIIVKPLESRLESIQPKRLIFVPTEDVSLVPFGAMIDEDDNYLIQRYAVATVSSLRLLNHCDKRRRVLRQQKQKSQTSSSLVVGNPSKDLYYATKEAEMVESFLKRANTGSVVNLLCEADATKDLVLQQLPESDWIHIASHGTVTADFPDGALVLAVPEEHRDDLAKSARSSEFEECLVRALTTASVSDRLTGDEVVELAGQGPFRASAAVLSACNSGIGRVFAEGILALPRSFHISGVPSVVISLWNVKDESTQVLMEKMYGNLVEEGMDIGSALQKAAVEMIEADDGCQKLYDVRHWAAFFVSGSPFTTLVSTV
ncbi:uncharacterized protein LOC9649348 [Selaginella moellendorffii]|uniref:uncharacterized protein LOC9649348 n=1 Tax=Selaginella moellendorffii TaxID=88036 RepID=UPI000D1C764D|nr:uncharacterized protein LOC9649348 [Selaginella moellendorffii]|eukprot:XP_024537300.1 uncharacterized protein LOC9649348 [Selaginella moellendorffii]